VLAEEALVLVELAGVALGDRDAAQAGRRDARAQAPSPG
jgi:hypothetical protein